MIFVVAVLHKKQEKDERFPSTVLKILIPKHTKKKKKKTSIVLDFSGIKDTILVSEKQSFSIYVRIKTEKVVSGIGLTAYTPPHTRTPDASA